MLVSELFNPVGLSQSFGGTADFLDNKNCKVVNKARQDSSVLLQMQRDEDSVEGYAYMRPRAEYAEVVDQLLKWAFHDPRILGLTLEELSSLETGLSVSSVGGKMQVNR